MPVGTSLSLPPPPSNLNIGTINNTDRGSLMSMIQARSSTGGTMPSPINALLTTHVGSSTVNAQRLDSAMRNLPHNQQPSIIDRNCNHTYNRGCLLSSVQSSSSRGGIARSWGVGATTALVDADSPDYIVAILPKSVCYSNYSLYLYIILRLPKV